MSPTAQAFGLPMTATMNNLVRERLLEAARTLLRGSSIYELSIAKIAAESGLARPTAYRYFSHPREVIRALADDTLAEIRDLIRDVEPLKKAPAYALSAVQVLTSDSAVNRQVILHSSVQAQEGKWIAQDKTPESLFLDWGIQPETALLSLTYFRGAMYSWATGFFTDEQFAEETKRAIAMRETQ